MLRLLDGLRNVIHMVAHADDESRERIEDVLYLMPSLRRLRDGDLRVSNQQISVALQIGKLLR